MRITPVTRLSLLLALTVGVLQSTAPARGQETTADPEEAQLTTATPVLVSAMYMGPFSSNFNPACGQYSTCYEWSLTLTDSTPGAVIYYTFYDVGKGYVNGQTASNQTAYGYVPSIPGQGQAYAQAPGYQPSQIIYFQFGPG